MVMLAAAVRPVRRVKPARYQPPKKHYPSVPKLWPDSTIVCVGSGPSLTAEDVDYCRGKAKVIAINRTCEYAPWADVLYAADERPWKWYASMREFPGLKYSLTSGAARWPGVQVLRNAGTNGLSREPDALCTGRNSGAQAINLAVHLGARRILLLGYDMGPGPKGQKHWHPDHPDRQSPPFQTFRLCFKTIVQPLRDLGIEVVNCSRQTSLDAFPRQPLREALS